MSRIFISSTAADLEEHRASVSEAIRRLGQQTIQMEVLAHDRTPRLASAAGWLPPLMQLL
jgi:hypothetical protein